MCRHPSCPITKRHIAAHSDPHVVESLIEAGKFHESVDTVAPNATLAEADLADVAERRKQWVLCCAGAYAAHVCETHTLRVFDLPG